MSQMKGSSSEVLQLGSTQVTVQGKQISAVGQDLTEIPEQLGDTFGASATHLDLSHNLIVQVSNLQKFQCLGTLVLDSNELTDGQTFPPIKTLHTLWMNGNKILDLETLLDAVQKAFPNLTYISLLKNPACPNYFVGKDQEDYQRYRYYVLHRLPNLKFLDASPVTPAEKTEAKRVGGYMRVVKIDPSKSKTAGTTGAAADEQSAAAAGRELPGDVEKEGNHTARFGVCRYVYYGRQSEGNRFILNSDL